MRRGYNLDIVEKFMKQYMTMIPDLKKIERHTRALVKTSLKDAGILAITTSRVKDSERLKEKLDIRNRGKHYCSTHDIIADIPDFIGIRIALYFPGDNDRVRSLIHQYFAVEKVKQFPAEQRENRIYQRKFPGYCATHYRVHLAKLPEGVSENHIIEIQVASLLMHAWSEVEHDLAYKQNRGMFPTMSMSPWMK